MAARAEDHFWYKDAIIYQLHVKAYHDSNKDGIGDFRGLIEKLDYISELGVNTLWLLPFYPSPMRDDGYDIADFRDIHPDYGTLKDFREFIRQAHRRDLRVITELVINHTSDQHPWFKAARMQPPGSKKRDFYVWSQTNQKFAETRIIFTDSETSNWTWDEQAQAYYWHRFFHHQPDLNHNNPEVVKAVIRVMRFWLDLRVDGLRLDAIPYLCVRDGTNNENLPETHAVLKQMRAVVDRHYDDRMFLAEANQWPEDAQAYFGDGDECHMAYHFPLMPRMYMALAQEERYPIVEIMQQTPEIPPSCQWAIFLRNHDELTLEMVTDRERDYMYNRYATDPRMRINVGIRRRLAPLMDNDPDKMKLMNSLLMSMPGSPIIYYGDEIGMGDNFFLGDRNGVRTPMQWSPDRNAGFSRADPQFLYLPPIMDPVYGYESVNVEAQNREPSSPLNWLKRLIAVRKAHPAFGRGSLQFLSPGNRKILAYVRDHDGETLLCVANLARSAQPVELDLSRYKAQVPVEMLGRTAFPPIGDLPYLLTLPGYGFYWFRLATEAEAPSWHEESLPPIELPVLVLFDGWRSFFPEQATPQRRMLSDKLRSQLEHDVLPVFVPAQRWFGAKADALVRLEIKDLMVWSSRSKTWLWLWLRVRLASGQEQIYQLPLAIAWGEVDDERIRPLLPVSLAKIRQQSRAGILYDAVTDQDFVHAIVESLAGSGPAESGSSALKFNASSAYPGSIGESELQSLRRPGSEGSNSSMILGERVFVKLYRRIQRGENAELEMGRYLTERARYPNISPLLGSLSSDLGAGGSSTLALVQAYIPNQGDAWNYTVDYLDRFLEDCSIRSQIAAETSAERHADYRWMINKVGRRTGELHRALATARDEPAFDPESVGRNELQAWVERVIEDLRQTLDLLESRYAAIPTAARSGADQLLHHRDDLPARVNALTPLADDIVKLRYHGDYHLGQVLLTENDFVIVDFEGEPARTLEERRTKHSPLRDVAGMLRSFDYAAAVALNKSTAERVTDHEQLQAYTREWQAMVETAFLDGYLQAADGCAFLPKAALQRRRLIDLFVIEKALYELRYELNNRIDWVRIPIDGLRSVLEPPTRAGSEDA